MAASADPLHVAFSFPSYARISMDNGFKAESSPPDPSITCMASWLSEDPSPQEQTNQSFDVLAGCSDGSYMLFRSSTNVMREVAPERPFSPVSRPASPASASFQRSRHSISTSRSSSPSGLTSPFNLTSRSRVAAAVSTEQVEAPKNYVDFEEEPDKLKEMLKGRAPKESQPDGRRRASSSRTRRAPSNDQKAPRQKQDSSRASLTVNSPRLTLNSLSPTSPLPQLVLPPDQTSQLTLIVHTVPPLKNPSSVSEIKLLPKHRAAVLHETGELSIIDVLDSHPIATTKIHNNMAQTPEGITPHANTTASWKYRTLSVHPNFESDIILVKAEVDEDAALDETADSDGLRCRAIAFLLFENAEDPSHLDLEAIAEWSFDGPVTGLELHHDSDYSYSLLNIRNDGEVTKRPFHVKQHTPPPEEPSPEPSSKQHSPFPLPNPFKSPDSPAPETKVAVETLFWVRLGTEHSVASLPSLDSETSCVKLSSMENGVLGTIWSSTELQTFSYNAPGVTLISRSQITGIKEAMWTDSNTLVVLLPTHLLTYDRSTMNSTASSDAFTSLTPSRTIEIANPHAILPVSPDSLLLSSQDSAGSCRLQLFSPGAGRALWTSSTSRSGKCLLTSVLPIDTSRIILGYDDGRIRQCSFVALLQGGDVHVFDKVSDLPLHGYITAMELVNNHMTGKDLIVGGADDGSIAIWSSDSLQLQARWILFISPLTRVLSLPLEDKRHPLYGCILCVSAQGSIAVIALEGFQFLYLVPGASAPLQQVCVGENHLLVTYENRGARNWDMRTKEFRRSMTAEKAEDMMKEGEWIVLDLDASNRATESIWSTSSSNTTATLCADLDSVLFSATIEARAIGPTKAQVRRSHESKEIIKAILSASLWSGVSEDLSLILEEDLAMPSSDAYFGLPLSSQGSLTSGNFVSLYPSHNVDVWTVSEDVSAARMLVIIVVLRALALFSDTQQAAFKAISLLLASGPANVGPAYKIPSPVYLARRWFNSRQETRIAAKLLFEAVVNATPDERVIEIVDEWAHKLPCSQAPDSRESEKAALALFICGNLAAQKYSLLSTSALTDVAKSTALYLHDDQSTHKNLAVDLCSKGFHIWQHYVDATEILRALFMLATASKKEGISTLNVGSQARQAVLQIASDNTPLFMATLGLDILSPSSVEHRKSVMQIVAFLIRKRPLVLYPNLPKLMEAVVRSLDPNLTAHRDAVLDTATEILGHVVKTFPNVDFHMATQRLAVGTTEGAIVMYDLKTAIRLYVLEGHKKSMTACSFSPDGRRLVTVSLDERVVLVWKVGSSFASFFNPGAPPKQGHAGSEPFKTLPFNVGDIMQMDMEETLHLVRFEWTGERSIKLKIRDSTLSFST